MAAALAGVVWGRKLLARVEYFNVRRVEVVGARWLAPDSVLELAAISRGHSVWGDYREVENGLARHPLIEEARVERAGFHALRLHVREVEPVALIGAPELRTVRGDGRLLPIDPTGGSLELPVLTAPAELATDSLSLREGPALAALRTFAALRALDPGLAAVVSDFGPAPDHGLRVNLVESQPARWLAVPDRVDEGLVRRLRAVLADLRGRAVEEAVIEARYLDQIVVRRGRL